MEQSRKHNPPDVTVRYVGPPTRHGYVNTVLVIETDTAAQPKLVIVAPSTDQASIQLDYIRGVLSASPRLASMVEHEDSATVLANRAATLEDLGRLTEALVDEDACLTIRRQLVAAGNTEHLPDLATVLMNRAATLSELGRMANAAASEARRAIRAR